MGEVPAEFCGYEWPKDCERFEYDNILLLDEDDSHQQMTCVREALPDTDYCAWHAAPDETKNKSITTLRNARVPAKVRVESEAGESLDGAVLAGMELESELNFSGTLLRSADLSETDFEGVDLSGADLKNANLSEASLKSANLLETDLVGADLSGTNLSFSDLSEATLTGANLSGATLIEANLSEATLIYADLSEAALHWADLSEADLSFSDLLEANLSCADLSEADLSRADLSGANLSMSRILDTSLKQSVITGANFTDAELSNLTVDRGTTFDSLANPRLPSPWPTFRQSKSGTNESENDIDEETTPNDWDSTARAYHDLKTEFHEGSLVRKARRLHIAERRARRHETAIEEGWFSREHLTQFVSGLFTGYGVGVWRLVGTMTALFAISTVTYALAGVADPLTYSTITFATSPPRPTGSLPIWARFVANVETFIGTLLIVSLGFVLGNREQF